MTNRRPRLRTKTTSLLYILAELGPGGAVVDPIARLAKLRNRAAAQRLRWLQRVGLVRYVADTAHWQLTDDSMFNMTKKEIQR